MVITHQQALHKLDKITLKLKQFRKENPESEELKTLRQALAEQKELWENTEKDYLRRIEELKKQKPVNSPRNKKNN